MSTLERLTDKQAVYKRLWCQIMHEKIMLPINGVYICSICQCEFPAWVKEDTKSIEESENICQS